jgi:hypothetical protein
MSAFYVADMLVSGQESQVIKQRQLLSFARKYDDQYDMGEGCIC